jgi:hypothetical protein
MSAQKQTAQMGSSFETGSQGHRCPILDPAREMWLQKYASRILVVWAGWRTPLGVAPAYADRIKKDLARFYDDPLKRLFIEASY